MDMVKIYEGNIMKDLVIDSSLIYGNTYKVCCMFQLLSVSLYSDVDPKLNLN